jgi:hypothetical protein
MPFNSKAIAAIYLCYIGKLGFAAGFFNNG